MKTFGGPLLFLDRSDINTDEIIPARYLTEITKQDLKPFILEDLKLPGFDPKSEKTGAARVIVSRANFGCGSSREHAPWVFEVNGIYGGCRRVVCPHFPPEHVQLRHGCHRASQGEHRRTHGVCGLRGCRHGSGSGETDPDRQGVREGRDLIGFAISPFDKALVLAGGWVDYADQRY